MTYGEILKRLCGDFRDYLGKKYFYYALGVGIFASIFASFEPFFGAKVIQLIEDGLKNNHFNTNTFLIFFGGWMAFIVINAGLRYYYRYYLIDINALKFYVAKSQFYKEKIIHITQGVYLEKKSGSFFKSFDRGIEAIFLIIFTLFLEYLNIIVSITVIVVIMLSINVSLTLATLGTTPFFFALGYYFHRNTRKKQSEIHKKWDSFFGFLGDYVQNLTLVKTLTFESKISKNLQNIQKEALDLQIPLSKQWAVADIYTHFIVNISRLFVLGVGIFLIKNGQTNFGILFLFYSYIGYIYFPLASMMGGAKSFQKNIEAIKKLYDDFDTIEQDKDSELSQDIQEIQGKITFQNVSFTYHTDASDEVLKNINFEIKPGEKIALVGSTGSGKSTITNLLLRFWDIKKGSIMVDGINIQNIRKSSLRKHIGIVMQDNSLFNTSILENMRFAKNDASEEEIHEALKKAKADFIFHQPQGIHTEIGERGLKLSGGEKQRINIARIFLKNPEILILDEATSALDNKTEIEIQQSLDTLMQGKTSLIIAHRLSTIKKVDKIFVLSQGQIVESGSYNELLSKKGYFYRLANPESIIIQ